MKSIELKKSGAAFLPVSIAPMDGTKMQDFLFLVDTGATRTTIPKDTLKKELFFTEDWIQENKILIPDNEKPIMANKKSADVYEIPITRINIGGHEIQHNYIRTSDTIDLSFLLGLDILSYFKICFDFDAVDNDAKHGRMYYEFRESRRKGYSKLGEPFAYQISNVGEN